MRAVPRQPAYSMCERRVGATTVVELCGELDLVTSPPVSTRLDPLTAGTRPQLWLDLRGVTFMDCRGVALLCRVRRRVRDSDGRLTLVVDGHRIPRILRALRLTDSFDIVREPPTGRIGLRQTVHTGPSASSSGTIVDCGVPWRPMCPSGQACRRAAV